MRERDAVWVELAEKSRPAVVIEVAEDLVRVAYGTTADPVTERAVVISPASLQGRRFGLTAATSFIGANTAWVAPNEIRWVGERSSSEVFFAIRALVDEHDAGRDSGSG